jgi:dihydroorotate dehydrogenase electron transfer subunit
MGMLQRKVRILSNTSLTSDCWKLAVEGASDLSEKSRPGQFVNLRISEAMDPLFRRPFSVFRIIPLAHGEKGLEIVYKVVGRGTRKMTALVPGDEVDMIGPCGNGFSLEGGKKTHVLLGGGVGAAALYMMGEQIVKSQEANTNLHIFLGANTKDSMILIDEFRNLKKDLKISTDDGTFGYRGMVTELFRSSMEEGEISSESVVYACGPEPMYRGLRSLWEKHRFSAQVSIERRMACGMGVCLSCICKVKKGEVENYRSLLTSHFQFSEQDDYGYALTCLDGPVFHLEEVVLNE